MRRDSSVILGVDVGGTTSAGALVDREGEARGAIVRPTRVPGVTVIENILGLIAELCTTARGRGLTVEGVGVGVPGAVDDPRGTISRDILNVPELQGLPLASLVRERTGLACVLDNDVNALALGEMYFGAARGGTDFVVIACGTGVGGGIVQGGRLLRGASGYGGEVGHMTVNAVGRPCFCGSVGCLKAYVAGPDIAETASEALKEEDAPLLRRRVSAGSSPLTSEDVFDAARQGDPVAQRIVENVVRYLGAGVGNILNILNPEMVILTGGVVNAVREQWERVLHWAEFYSLREAFAAARIVYSAADKRASARGAAALYLYERPRGGLFGRWKGFSRRRERMRTIITGRT